MGALATGSVTFANNANAKEKVIAAEIGMQRRILKLLQNGRGKKANEIIENQNINSVTREQKVPSNEMGLSDTDETVTPDGYYNDGDSKLIVNLLERTGEIDILLRVNAEES